MISELMFLLCHFEEFSHSLAPEQLNHVRAVPFKYDDTISIRWFICFQLQVWYYKTHLILGSYHTNRSEITDDKEVEPTFLTTSSLEELLPMALSRKEKKQFKLKGKERFLVKKVVKIRNLKT